MGRFPKVGPMALLLGAAWSCGGQVPATAPPPQVSPVEAPPPPPNPTPATAPAEATPPATDPTPTNPEADRWIRGRAERMGLTLEAAAARDAAMAVGPGEDGLWWDRALAEETHELWGRLCKECHQGARKLEKVVAYPPPPRDWARTETRFFTWDHTPKTAFDIVLAGAKARPGEKDMPAWRGTLSHEQVWGLIYFVNRASMGKKSGLK